MGIYERDYERGYDTGSGWRDSYSGGGSGGGGFASWSANSKLLAVLIAVYLLQNLTSNGGQPAVSWLTDWLVLPADWVVQPWRIYGLVSYSLLHSLDSVSHVLFNGLAIFFFGRVIEQRLGAREYLTFFFAAAIFAGIAWSVTEVLLTPEILGGLEEERVPTLLGASGGIAGIVLLFALWYPNVQVYLMGVIPVPAWLMAVLFLGQDVMGALSRSGNVAYTAHLGGALFGYLYYRYRWRVSGWLPGGGFDWGSLFKSKPKLRVHRMSEDEEDEAINPGDERVDEILRKIQAQGQESLTREEQRVLERASRRYKNRRR